VRGQAAFEDDEDQADIANGEEGLLPVVVQDVGEWFAIDDSNGRVSLVSQIRLLAATTF
jgi:hypothetical protein